MIAFPGKQIIIAAFFWTLFVFVLNELAYYWFVKELIYALEWFTILWILFKWYLGQPKQNYVTFLLAGLFVKSIWGLCDGMWLTEMKVTLWHTIESENLNWPKSWEIERRLYYGTYGVNIAGHYIILSAIFVCVFITLACYKSGCKMLVPKFIKKIWRIEK